MGLALRGGGGGGGGGNRSRERRIPYGVMLLLAFGAAVLGVMILHKLKERRVVTLLIRDKDRDLMTLHLLLQKERESSKELKRKIEELKTKTSSLRAQKVELANKFTEMQSMVLSLKDEHGALEAAVEEKQNEIRLLQQREMDASDNQKSQIALLTEILKQKEMKIEEMKRQQVGSPTKIWSVSTDDPSKASAGQVVHDEDRTVDASPKEEPSEETTKQDDGENVVKGEDASKINASEGNKAETAELEKQPIGLGGTSNVGEDTEESLSAEIVVDEMSGAIEKNNTNEGLAVDLNEKVGDTEGATGDLNEKEGDAQGARGSAIPVDGVEHELELESPEGIHDRQPFGKISKHVMKLKKSSKLRKRRRGGRRDHNESGGRNAFAAGKQSKVSVVSQDSKYNLKGEEEMESNEGMLHTAADGKQSETSEEQIGKQQESETAEDSTESVSIDLENKLDDMNTDQTWNEMPVETENTLAEPNRIRNKTGKIDEMIKRRGQYSDGEENSTENSLNVEENTGTEGQEASFISRSGGEGENIR